MASFQSWLSIDPFTWSSVGTCIVCGGVVGLERQLRGKPVGILTATLIVLGTYIFLTVTTTYFGDSGDPTRIIGQIVTGIGFLGAGVMLSKDGVILGVTSAATIWVLAAIGVIIPVAGNLPAIKMPLHIQAKVRSFDHFFLNKYLPSKIRISMPITMNQAITALSSSSNNIMEKNPLTEINEFSASFKF